MVFDLPNALRAAPVVGLVVALLALWARGVRVRRANLWSSGLGHEARRMGRWGAVPLALAAIAAMAAFAGPRWGTRVVETETKGLNLVLAVDISRSMLAEDMGPSRLDLAKREAGRIIHDLRGDRIGLIAFAGRSFIMSPLTIDGSALNLMVEGLDPDISSAGGTELARVLVQGHDLLLAKEEVADRVLVVFTDGEAHDSLPGVIRAAERLRRDGVHVVLVAEGTVQPTRIPVRDETGTLIGYQRDPSDKIVLTKRRDDIMSAVADATHGMVVSAEEADQAGAVREFVSALKRVPEATTTAAQDVLRAWIPLLVAVTLLLGQALTRRTAALVVLVLSVTATSVAQGQAPRNPAEVAWMDGRFDEASRLYLEQVRAGAGGDSVWYNVGTAGLAANDSAMARSGLERAARSLDPGVRFRAEYNLGLLELRLSEVDSVNRMQHLEEARRHYVDALLLKPGDVAAKWNLELTLRRMPPPPESAPPRSQGSAGEEDSPPPPMQGLSAAQAEQILNSVAEEERETRRKLSRRRSQTRTTRGRRDW
ncbi:MAG: VWA domain-containing protein [Gemmatimonadales bacterium]